MREGKREGNGNRKYWPIAVAVFAADRITKILARGIPAEGQVLIPGVVGLRYAENRGIAFSMLSGAPWALGLISLAIIIGAFLLTRGKEMSGLRRIGLMMMLGGAAGNMVDRFYPGYVTDMIEVLFMNFAIFNVADMCLCIGCGIVIVSLLKE